MPRRHQFTVYDVMEAKGVFEANPANPGSRNEQGEDIFRFQEFPKMFYHPQGALRTIVPAEIIMTPMGPKAVGEQKEVIWELAKDAEEEARLRASGWHSHPSRAVVAGGGQAAPVSAQTRIEELEAQIRQMQLERNSAMASTLAPPAKPLPKAS